MLIFGALLHLLWTARLDNRDGFEDNMFEAIAKAKASSLQSQGQFSSRPRPRPVIMIVEKNKK